MKTQNNKTESFPTRSGRLFKVCALALTVLYAGCGGGGGDGTTPSVNAVASAAPSVQAQVANSFSVSSDDYGVEKATYLSATKSPASIVLRAAVANGMTDPNFRTVARIDIVAPQAVKASGAYSLGAAASGLPAFPGHLDIFNGHQSTLLRTVGGTINFTAFGTNGGDKISGSFSAIIEDGNDSTLPKGSYTVAGNFSFALESVGPVLPAVAPVSPNAAAQYQANCVSCHALGTLDPTAESASNLSLKGGKMNGRFTADMPSHQGIRLAASDISDLKVLLNVN